MDTSKIGNSESSIKKYTDVTDKSSIPNHEISEKIDKHQFDIYLNKQINEINQFNKQNQQIKMFVPDDGKFKTPDKVKPFGGTNVNQYSETFISSKVLGKLPKSTILQQYNIYKEDQLLSNPGGDNYFIGESSGVVNDNYDHSKFSKRVGKDLKDAGSNILNAVKNIGVGAKFNYVNKHGKIEEGTKVGFAKTLAHFFKNVVSGLTFGAYTPKGEVVPQGGIGRIKHFFGKIFKDAILGNVVKGVSGSVINVGEDIMLAGLNTIETVPDATIGNLKAGRKATTRIFDNAQVVLDLATDVMPGGEASERTRAMNIERGFRGLPVIHNLTASENGSNEENWKYVRNTSFRKIVETLLSLIPFRI